MADVVLWHFPVSHYNEKVRWALDWKRIPHRRRALTVDYLPRALWATGRGTLPILFLDGKAIGDSTRIIEALERFQPAPGLYPADERARRRALDLEDFFDEELGHALRTALLGPIFAGDPDAVVAIIGLGMPERARRMMRGIFPAFRAFYMHRHRIDAATIAAAPRKVEAALDRVAAELQPSGYLVGDGFSVADLTAASLFSPLVQPPEFPYQPTRPPPEALMAFRASFERHRAFQWVLDMYHRHRGTSAEIALP
jgi:glutathione S-transferase